MAYAFKRPKHPAATGWYRVRWKEPLSGSPAVSVLANPDSAVALQSSAVQLSQDGFAVVFKLAGGSNGSVWDLQVSAQAQDGSVLVEDIRLAVAI